MSTLSSTADPTSATRAGPVVAILMPLALKRGGCEVMLINLLKANRLGPGIDYRICFLEDGPMVQEVRNLGYPVHLVPVGRLRQAGRFVRSVLQLRRWFKQQGVTQVLSWMEKAHLYASPAAGLAGVPAAWWLHSIDPTGRIIRLITALPANHVFSDSRAAADLQETRTPRRPTTVCHCAVDVQAFSPDRLPSPRDLRAQLDLPHDRPVVSIIARLQRWKGVDVFIAAAARVRSAGLKPAPCFVVVGGEHNLEPGVKPELEAQINSLDLARDLKMVGYQSNIPQWMHASDVIVHCSTGVEPFGTVIVEAMALGKNVVAAKAGGPLEIIHDGLDGRLATPGDPAALADAIVASLEDTDTNRRMRSLAIRRADYFSSDRLSTELATALKKLSA